MRQTLNDSPRRIVLILREMSGYVRDVVDGVVQYVRPHQSWMLRRMLPHSYNEKQFLAWEPDGVISSLGLPALTASLKHLGVPVAGMSDLLETEEAGFDKICPDDVAIARSVSEYFLAAGFTSFGFVGARGYLFSKLRQQAFGQAMGEQQHAVSTIELKPAGPWGRYLNSQDNRRLDTWLAGLPRPAAIFAANDELSLPVSEACHRIGLRIPEDVALVGVDNDRLLCELSWPPLSSVMVPARRIGYELAELLEQRMTGQLTGPPVRKLLPPVGIKVRQSSDILAIDDSELAAALRFIRENASQPIDVGSILRNIPVSRRSLERKFKQMLGRSPLDEIHRVRVQRAKQILSGTDLAMPDVARRSGLGDNKQMCAIFRKLVGMTPTQWRNQSRVRNVE